MSPPVAGADGPGGDAAEEMWLRCLAEGQAALTVSNDADAAALRAALRELGRAERVRIRTARMGDVVVVARLDAAIWTDDTATMRAKLTPPG